MKEYPGLARWALTNHEFLKEENHSQLESEGDMSMGEWSENCKTTGFEAGAQSPEPRNVGNP